MADSPQTIRIFISSPGDVTEERDGARRVIEGLERLYPRARLVPVLWEELALPVTASFQETIDFLLEREPIDVAVFILWSRLGSPLGTSITRPDGTPYRSGTERELDLMLAAFEQSGRKRPVILAYVREDDAGLKLRFNESDTSEWEELINQRKLAEAFILEQFHDAEGRNLRAYQTYREPVGFVQRLRLHLRHAIDDLLEVDAAPSWTDEPYRGLEAFDVRHAPIFFGRDEEILELLQRRRDQEQAGCAFAVIVGASGSGKSSLAKAGIAASLIQNAGDNGMTKQWRASTFVPGLAAENLCAALVRSIAETLPELSDSTTTLDDVAKSLAENAPLTVRLSIMPAFARASDQAGGEVRLLLVLDQLEELWTNRQTTSDDRERFLAAIEALAQSGHVAVLATLRSDFYSHAQQMPAFLRLKGERGHYDLLPPDAASVQRLITEPARLAGLQFEQHEQTGRSLDDVILEDAARDPNALPLLQYTLAELYEQRDQSRRLLTFAAYDELGGVEGALGKHANETFASLPEDAQDALDEILPLLVTVDVAGELAAVRRRASMADLTSTPARKALTDHLTAARFLTTDRQGDASIASLAHEALFRRWDRIVTWISANREQLRLRARVEQSQQRWEQQDRDDSLLLATGLPLDEGRKLLREAAYLLTETTTDYIRDSIRHDEHKAKRSRQRRTIVASMFVCILLIGSAVSIYFAIEAMSEAALALNATRDAEENAVLARRERDEAERQKDRASRRLYSNRIASAQREWETGSAAAAWDQLRACQWDLRGWEHNYLFTKFTRGVNTLRGHTHQVRSVAFSPDGSRIVSGSVDNTLKLWDAKSGEETLTFQYNNPVMSVAFSPDSARIASGSSDGTIKVWDVQSGKETLTFEVGARVGHVAFSPDGSRIVSSSQDRTLRVWDSQSGEETLSLKFSIDGISSVAFSPDGTRIVSGAFEGTLVVWDSQSGEETLALKGHTSRIYSVAFSPDGSRIVSGSNDGALKVWDVQSGEETLTLSGHAAAVMSVAFSPDGSRIVSGSDDNTLKLWDAQSGEETLTLKGHAHGIHSVAFSSDSARIVSGSFQTLKVWDARTGEETLTLEGHAAGVKSMAFSPDGTRIVSGSEDSTIKVWDVKGGEETLTLRGHSMIVSSVAFSPDGSRIVSGSYDRTLKVWEAQRHEAPLTQGEPVMNVSHQIN